MNAGALLEGLAPLGMVALGSIVLVLADAVFTKGEDEAREHEVGSFKGSVLTCIAGLFLFFSMVAAGLNFASAPATVGMPGDMLVVDAMASFAMALLCGGGLVTLWFARAHLPLAGIHHGEFYALLMFTMAGALAVVCAGNFVSLFAAIELTSVPLYVLAAFDRDRARSVESGTRLLLTGGFASGVLLYGIALVYGATGSFDYASIQVATAGDSALANAGVALVLVGLLARIAVAPFHYWLPNVGEGAPTVVAACVATTLVTASAFALLRLEDALFSAQFAQVLSLLAGLSMLVGGGMALVQTNVKRILAYGGVAHMGFFLAASVVDNAEGNRAALLVVATFLFMQLGAFGALTVMTGKGAEAVRLAQYAGLAERRPILAAAMSLFLLGLAGLPGTSGFISRLQAMSVAIGAGHILLTLAMGVASVILFAAYLRIPIAMYMGHGSSGRAEPTPLPALVGLLVCAFATLCLGIYPSGGPFSFDMLEVARRAALP